MAQYRMNQWALISLPRIGTPRVVACSRVVSFDAEALDCDPQDMGIDLGPDGADWRAGVALGFAFALWKGMVSYSDDCSFYEGKVAGVGLSEAQEWLAKHEGSHIELPEESLTPDGLG